MKSLLVFEAPYISPADKRRYSDLKVLKSAAGWYIGTLYSDGNGFIEPGSRDSEYFASEESANEMLSLWESIYNGEDEECSFLYPKMREHF